MKHSFKEIALAGGTILLTNMFLAPIFLGGDLIGSFELQRLLFFFLEGLIVTTVVDKFYPPGIHPVALHG